MQNGWKLTYHVFDYNLDFFEVGALNEDAWKLADGPARYMQRALAARGGLWGNHGYEAAYAMVYPTATASRSTARRAYELRVRRRRRRCGAFWSVTMYDTPDFFLVDNPIGRYSIGDRTAGLQRDAEGGSLTIYMQHEAPRDPGAARELAAVAGRSVPADPADVRARRLRIRRRLRAAADHAPGLTLRPAQQAPDSTQ